MDRLTFFSNLIDSIAWPAAAVLLVLLFRRPLLQLFLLLRKMKVRDVEFEFDKIIEYAKDVKAYHAITGNPLPEDGLPDHYRQLVKDKITTEADREERIMLVLYYYHGQTDAEVAETLGLSEDYITQKRLRFIGRLKKLLCEAREHNLLSRSLGAEDQTSAGGAG